MTDTPMKLWSTGAAGARTAAPAAAALAAWRQLDWRFLLPEEELGGVGLVGTWSTEERQALTQLGATVQEVGDDAGLDAALVRVDGDSSCSLPRTLDRLSRALRPGGWVLLRLVDDRREVISRATGARLRVRRRQLRAAGFVDARTYWHAPSSERPSYMVRLEDRRAVETMLGRHHGVPLGRMKALGGRLLAGSGALPLTMGGVTLLARRPSPGAPPAPAPSLFVTPWFEASRHVVELVLGPDGDSVVSVRKMPRRPWDVQGIQDEAAALARLTGCAAALTGSVPAVLELRMGPRPVLHLGGLSGRPVDPDFVRKDPDRVVAAATRFLSVLASHGDHPDDHSRSRWFEDLVVDPLRRYDRLVSDEGDPLVRSTLQVLSSLSGAALTFPFEHGDLGHPNLLMGPDGRLSVLDWERARPGGLPLNDLVFLLQYVSECRAAATARADQCKAFDQAFLAGTGWARPVLSGFAAARGVPEAAVGPLIVACWARTAAGLPDRLNLVSPRGQLVPDAHRTLREAVAADRDSTLWRHCITRHHEGLL